MISERLIDAVKKFEGFDLRAYWDAYGKTWTIGWGRTHGVKEGDTTTAEAEHAWLVDELERLQGRLRELVSVGLTQYQEEALISFVFNVGLGAFQASTLRKRLNAGDHAGAAREFDRWVHASDIVLKGLVTRRAEERSWFEAVRNS